MSISVGEPFLSNFHLFLSHLNLWMSKALNRGQKSIVKFRLFFCMHMIYNEKKVVCRKCMYVWGLEINCRIQVFFHIQSTLKKKVISHVSQARAGLPGHRDVSRCAPSGRKNFFFLISKKKEGKNKKKIEKQLPKIKWSFLLF